MKTEFVKATDPNTKEVGQYEVDAIFLTWTERKMDVKNNDNSLVYYPAESKVIKWHSVNKSTWEQCKRVLRKIN